MADIDKAYDSSGRYVGDFCDNVARQKTSNLEIRIRNLESGSGGGIIQGYAGGALQVSLKEDNTILLKGNVVGEALEDWSDRYVGEALEDWTDKEI